MIANPSWLADRVPTCCNVTQACPRGLSGGAGLSHLQKYDDGMITQCLHAAPQGKQAREKRGGVQPDPFANKWWTEDASFLAHRLRTCWSARQACAALKKCAPQLQPPPHFQTYLDWTIHPFWNRGTQSAQMLLFEANAHGFDLTKGWVQGECSSVPPTNVWWWEACARLRGVQGDWRSPLLASIWWFEDPSFVADRVPTCCHLRHARAALQRPEGWGRRRPPHVQM